MSNHIIDNADIAPIVLMPGDPLRARYIADEILEKSVRVNDIRGCNGYTGFYKGKKITVQASGMGMPSLGIYVNELYRNYAVEKIIRIGTCGSIHPTVDVGDVVVALSAATDSNIARNKFDVKFSPCCSYSLLQSVVPTLQLNNKNVHVGQIFSTDNYYTENDVDTWIYGSGLLAVDMETYYLYHLSTYYGEALTVNLVSDKAGYIPLSNHQKIVLTGNLCRDILDGVVSQ